MDLSSPSVFYKDPNLPGDSTQRAHPPPHAMTLGEVLWVKNIQSMIMGATVFSHNT